MSRKLFVVFLMPLLFSGCAVYQPRVADIPLLQKQNDLKIEAAASSAFSLQATVSYALTNHIAVQAFGNISGDSIFYLQPAIGFYKKLDDKAVLELYAGYGYGKGNTSYMRGFDADAAHLYGNYQVGFAQLNYGWPNFQVGDKMFMDIGFAVKMGYMYSSLYSNYYYDDKLGWLNDHNLLLEPSSVIAFGTEKFKMTGKLGLCGILKLTNRTSPIPYIPFNFGLGITYKF